MEAPSGAGYVPRESVLDNILQLFNTFGADAKKRRAGELTQQSAQTDHINAQTAEIPNQSAMGWDSHALQREQMVQQQKQHDDSSGLGWSELSNRQSEFAQRLPMLESAAKDDSRRVDAAEAQNRMYRDQQDEQNWLNMAKFQQEGKQHDDLFAEQKLRLDQSAKQDKTRDLITMAGQEFDPKKRAALSDNILGALAPELAAQQAELKRAGALEAEKLLHPDLFGPDGQRRPVSDLLSTPINSTDPTIRQGGIAGGTGDWWNEIKAKWNAQPTSEDSARAAAYQKQQDGNSMNPVNWVLGTRKPNPNYKPPKESSPAPSGRNPSSVRLNNSVELPTKNLPALDMSGATPNPSVPPEYLGILQSLFSPHAKEIPSRFQYKP